jgi:glycosyltransferase involved in cell wall biosynthesis
MAIERNEAKQSSTFMAVSLTSPANVRVAVVIPNRNHAQFLDQAISSWARQTRLPDELIIIDDASTDNSLEVISTWEGRLDCIRLVRHLTQIGVVGTLNHGLCETGADFVAFSAADDSVAPRFLEASLAALHEQPDAAFAAGAAQLIDDSGTAIGVRPILLPSMKLRFFSGDDFRRLLLRGDNFFIGGVTLYRCCQLKQLGGFDPTLRSMADGMIARRMASRFGFCFIPEVLGLWRIHRSQTNYSINEVMTDASFNAMIASACATIDAEPDGTYPNGYRELLARRLRFGRLRLMVESPEFTAADSGTFVGLLGNHSLDRIIVEVARKLGPASSVLLLLWAALRLRPFSFVALLLEPLRKRLALYPRTG